MPTTIVQQIAILQARVVNVNTNLQTAIANLATRQALVQQTQASVRLRWLVTSPTATGAMTQTATAAMMGEFGDDDGPGVLPFDQR